MVRGFGCLALALVCLAGCGDGGVEVSQRQMKLLGELRDTLAKIEDPASLKAALPTLETLSQQLAETQAELNKQQTSTEQQRDLRAKYGPELTKLTTDLTAQTSRIDQLKTLEAKDLDQLIATITPATASVAP